MCLKYIYGIAVKTNGKHTENKAKIIEKTKGNPKGKTKENQRKNKGNTNEKQRKNK